MSKIGMDFVRKQLAKAKVVQRVQDFEEEVTSPTPTSKGDAVRQRIEDRIGGNSVRSITGLTPTLAPTMLFVKASGAVKNTLAFDGLFRRFSVSIANFSPSEVARGRTKSPYDMDVTIEVGYPDQVSTKVGSTLYLVDSLKSEDDELIDQLMRAGDLLNNPSAIADATVNLFGGAYDIGNTNRRHRYVITATRTWS